MVSNLKLSAKLLGTIVAILAITSGISFWIMQNRANRQAEDAFRDKLRQITGMASATRNWFAGNIDLMVPNRDFKHLEQVPVVVAMRTAEEYASKEGMKFRTPSLHPRNPKNQATDFERRALEAFERDSTLAEFYDRAEIDGREIMRYAQPVRVEQDCLQCHGDPAGQKDPFGYPKEGMKAGELRAAFVLEAPTDKLVQESRSNMMATFLVSFFTVLAAIVVMYYVLRQLVIRPVKECAEFAEAIAAKNLSLDDLDVSSADEVGDAMTAMNTMKNNLHAVVQAIADTSGHVASASAELSATSQQISANSEETSAQVGVVSQATQQVSQNLQSVSTGAGEMTTTIQSIASNAHEAASVASSAVQTAQAANNTISKLGESSAEIGEVIKVITSIAQQTNLLALNATIEAARAGEAGKGFAVVANEVKELAKQTAKATEDISRKITAIQQDTKGAVDAIGSIGTVINKVNDISSTIATAVEEQSATTNEMTRSVGDAAKGSAEITRNIEGVAEAARGTSSSAQESQKAADELAEMAAQLRGLVAQFKIVAEGAVEAGPAAAPMRARAAHAGR
ncbi:MAG TPA: methyl-accepting chemotaxis protein [Candidatus Acidoferrales bacterium]|nr:methyl-accepting chemotaxis protein [Candidatus Acidoferrales bacterium]